jgi:hypothetical protein
VGSQFTSIDVESDWPRVSGESRLPYFVGQDDSAAVSAAIGQLRLGYVGLGSVGLSTCLHGARLRPRAIYTIDPGRWKAESVLTHPIYSGRVGEPKATAAGRLCKWISPTTEVFALDGPIDRLAAEELTDLDYLLLATDNLQAELTTSELSRQLGIPLIQASVDGATLVAQIRTLANSVESGPCLGCGFNRAEWDYLNSGAKFSCEGYYEGEQHAATAMVTRSTSSLCSIAADLSNMQLLRRAGGLGKSVDDTVLEYCGFTHKTVVSPLPRREDCVCVDHRPWRRRSVAGRLSHRSPGELVEAALGFSDDLATIRVRGDWFTERAACSTCGPRPVRRFVNWRQDPPACDNCGRPLAREPFFAHRPVLLEALGQCAERPLVEACDLPVRSVVVQGRGETVLLVQEAEAQQGTAT